MGLVILNKKAGVTSNAALGKVKRELGIKKAGHTGTLDPAVSGVLPIFTEKSTKLIPLFTENKNNFKIYECEMIFGKKTDTQDYTGETIASMKIEEGIITIEQIRNIAKNFIGKIEQIPPKYSAKKINGKRAYELVRSNVDFEMKPHQVEIFEINFEDDIKYKDDYAIVNFIVKCSKGTYIRTLCEDIGGSLKIPATMKKLVRTASDGFSIEQSCEIDNGIEVLDPLQFLGYEKVQVTEFEYKKIINGNEVELRDLNYPIIYEHNGSSLAIYEQNSKANNAKPLIMLI